MRRTQTKHTHAQKTDTKTDTHKRMEPSTAELFSKHVHLVTKGRMELKDDCVRKLRSLLNGGAMRHSIGYKEYRSMPLKVFFWLGEEEEQTEVYIRGYTMLEEAVAQLNDEAKEQKSKFFLKLNDPDVRGLVFSIGLFDRYE